MTENVWGSSELATRFADDAYATVKGHVRTYVINQHLLEHLAPAPASVLDIGGGAGHQSFPLAQAGYDVTVLDSSPQMLAKARTRLQQLPEDARRRVRFIEADGADADSAVNGQRFDAVLCHGVLGYLATPDAMIDQVCRCTTKGGVVSILTGNAATTAVRPALERRWEDALAAFDTDIAIVPGLNVQGRGDTVDGLGQLLQARGVDQQQWYGVWVFVDWLEFSGVSLDPDDAGQLVSIAAVELEASKRDPYRQLSRAFHLLGRKT